MPLVRLVCWNRDLAPERAAAIKAAGFEVDASPLVTSSLIGQFRALNPAAVVIDLDRLPSHGREIGTALRNGKSTRLIPLVFAGGAAEKVARVRQELPDATYTEWRRIGPAIKQATKNAPLDPVKPTAHMERYRGTSLVQKLGIKAGMAVALIAPAEGFEETLGELPESVALESRITPRTRLVLWFVRSEREVAPAVESLSVKLPQGASVWMVYPKQAGRYKVNFNENDVRAAALPLGLVDYKVCAVDADWTGLKFARRK